MVVVVERYSLSISSLILMSNSQIHFVNELWCRETPSKLLFLQLSILSKSSSSSIVVFRKNTLCWRGKVEGCYWKVEELNHATRFWDRIWLLLSVFFFFRRHFVGENQHKSLSFFISFFFFFGLVSG